MKNSIAVLLILFLGTVLCYGQSSQRPDNLGNTQLEKIPQESVFIHHNKSLLFTGESLKYKFYGFDNAKKSFTEISKIGYVSLVGKDGRTVFNHKLDLSSGLGYGDFFIPTSVPTGSYKLLGYSEWMKNGAIELFFQSDIYIVNPFQVVPDSYLEKELDSSKLVANSASTAQLSNVATSNGNKFLKLMLDKQNAGNREKIQIQLSALNEEALKGNYSISVQKVNTIPSSSKVSSEMFFADFIKRKRNISLPRANKANVPELRGELISGIIKDKNTKLPVKDQRISLSFPGDDYLFKIATSNIKGEFHFNLGRKYENETAVLQILSEDWDQFDIAIANRKRDYKTISFKDFVLSSEMKDDILERSIQNQLEIAYQEVKSDAITPIDHSVPFYRKFTTVYDLDDYTRFNSLPETIIEVVDQVGIRKLANGDRVFEVRHETELPNDNLQPMVFVDGLFLKRHENFIGYSAKKIKSISFSREKYLLGSQTFQGVLHFKTIEGTFFEDFNAPHTLTIDLFKPQSDKNYFTQTYTDAENQKRTPDFRNQLLWVPMLELESDETQIDFYTSDVAGMYEVVLEGFTLTGKPVTIVKKFSVK